MSEVVYSCDVFEGGCGLLKPLSEFKKVGQRVYNTCVECNSKTLTCNNCNKNKLIDTLSNVRK
jgi:hypothetical protein